MIAMPGIIASDFESETGHRARQAQNMKATTWHSDSPRHLDKALRDDVRLLGEILGRVIAADRGAAFVDRIERIRALAKAARSGGGAEWDELSALLESIPASISRTSPNNSTRQRTRRHSLWNYRMQTGSTTRSAHCRSNSC
jgi:phosphoenolpyruvate carboxylase